MAAPLCQKARRTNGDSNRSTAHVVAIANGSVLPQDLIYEILVRIPVKPLCRLRAVCQSWRSLLSDTSFVVAHSARHGPLVAAFNREPAGVHILDTSGQIVRQIQFEDCAQHHYANVACTNLDLFCFVGAGKRPRVNVINPATGVVSILPYDSEIDHKILYTVFAIGRVSLTGEAKVLAAATRCTNVSSCKVLTLTLGDAGKWRETGCAPTSLVNSSKWVALVKGVLYFMGYDKYRHDHIAAYDLETETWRPDLFQFPLPFKGAGGALVELSDSLVAVYYSHNSDQMCDLSMDLWFLTDTEKVLWSKRFTVTMPYQGFPRGCYASTGHPLWALDNEKIVFSVWHYLKDKKIRIVHLLRVYDARINTYTDEAEVPGYTFAGVYKGSLLAGRPWIRN